MILFAKTVIWFLLISWLIIIYLLFLDIHLVNIFLRSAGMYIVPFILFLNFIPFFSPFSSFSSFLSLFLHLFFSLFLFSSLLLPFLLSLPFSAFSPFPISTTWKPIQITWKDSFPPPAGGKGNNIHPWRSDCLKYQIISGSLSIPVGALATAYLQTLSLSFKRPAVTNIR